MSTKAPNSRCKFDFGNRIFRILILQTTCFTVYLHGVGAKSRFSFGILIFQAGLQYIGVVWDQGTKLAWIFSSTLHQGKHVAQSARISMLLGQFWAQPNPDLALGPLSSKPVYAILDYIGMILGSNPESVLESLSSRPVYSIFL